MPGGLPCRTGTSQARLPRDPAGPRPRDEGTRPEAIGGLRGVAPPASTSIPGMNVVFVEPFFPHNQRHFARALAGAGATVIGIGEYPADALDGELKSWLHHYEQVRSVTDVAAMTAAVRWVQDNLWVDR